VSKLALVCGSARSLWDDLTRVGKPVETRAAIVAVNITAQFLPRVSHIVSLHGDLPGLLRQMREHMDMALREHQPAVVTHSIRAAPGVDRVWGFPATGSSSLLAVRVALGLGYDRVICCGVPLDSTGRFYDDPRKPSIWDWEGLAGEAYRVAWKEAADMEFAGRVRSCSGWTRDLLGAPE
jgi:hypothetical protein